jgi:hypothetical protein
MTNSDEFERPDINDEALITKVVNYLKYNDPHNATREDAVSLLAFMQTVAKEVAATTSDENFDDYYKAYKEQQAKK